MALEDKDLVSVQEVRNCIKQAVVAQKQLAGYSQEQVDAIVREMARSGRLRARELAEMAVEETQLGVVDDKETKNTLATEVLYDYIKDMQTVGAISSDPQAGIVEFAEPVGVIGAVTPVTNPTSTLLYKSIIALKSRNSIVFNAHPRSARCCKMTADIMEEAAVSAGAPVGSVSCVTNPTLASSQELMNHEKVAMILATGGGAMVRAAYSTGKPALGVGPGNVPVVIESTADIQKAAADIVKGKSFDNGTVCSSEQSVIIQRSLLPDVFSCMVKEGVYFLDGEQAEKLEKVMAKPGGGLNPRIVGQPAAVIAEWAGLQVPAETRVLGVAPRGVGPEHPLSMEKLSPVLAVFSYDDWEEACDLALKVLYFGGLGHSAVIHSHDHQRILDYAQRVPTSRVLVNTPSTHGAVGASTNLPPSMTLGSGTWGKSSTTDSVSPRHLLNIKRLAFGT